MCPLGALRLRCPGPLGSCSPVCPRGLLCCVYGVLGHLAPVHRCARLVRCFASAVSWATWLLFTGAPARCVVLRVRSPGPLGSSSPTCDVLCVLCPRPLGSCLQVCPLGVLCWVCGVLGHLGLFTGVPAPSVAVLVRCHGPLGSCSPVCSLGLLSCLCGVLGHWAPVHRCARSVLSFARAVCWATWLLFTGVPAMFVVLRVRCPGPLGSCSPVCLPGVLCFGCGVLGLLPPVHRSAHLVCCAVGCL